MDYNGKIMFNYHSGAWSDTNIGFYNDEYNTGSNCIIENPKRDEGGWCYHKEEYHKDCIQLINEYIDSN